MYIKLFFFILKMDLFVIIKCEIVFYVNEMGYVFFCFF